MGYTVSTATRRQDCRESLKLWLAQPMSTDAGFIDLRINNRSDQQFESFWPSFTDIMTVIVMIFMIAMVILLLRNIELVTKLRATMAAERSAIELARTTGEEKEGLSLRLIAAENELAIRRMQQLKMEETIRGQELLLESQEDEIAALQAANNTLSLESERREEQRRELAERLDRSNNKAASLQASLDSLRQVLNTTLNELADSQRQLSRIQQDVAQLQQLQEEAEKRYEALDKRYGEQSLALLEAKSAMRRSGFQLNVLQGEYDDLKIRYNELFRPARSPAGRFLVEVRYYKLDGERRIEVATDADSGFRRVTRGELEKILTVLKESKKEGLYIKVIFPEDSGLTYNEAWKFTSGLHARYDYYSQERAEAPSLPIESE